MASIARIVRKSLRSGWLTADAEAQIRQQFQTCSLDDLEALSVLQDAVVSGQVQRVPQMSGIQEAYCSPQMTLLMADISELHPIPSGIQR